MSATIVAFHAHPDDEALLTAGTMARLASEGHRVVLVLATDGGAGLAAAELRADGQLGGLRLTEARAIGGGARRGPRRVARLRRQRQRAAAGT
jgi:LmbE family N-acetylglucosaminyl deacetylase